MRIIGLCGRSGSGKGTFCAVARKNGLKVIDCDAVYKELVSSPSPCLAEIAEYFGEAVIKNNSLDRSTLANIVFSDSEKLMLLNRITHKHIICEINAMISQYDEGDIVILDAPTLFESGVDGMCELVIGILSDDVSCIERITARDGISKEKAVARLSNQLTNDFIIEHSNLVIYNDSNVTAFERASQELIESLKEGNT